MHNPFGMPRPYSYARHSCTISQAQDYGLTPQEM